EPRLDEGRDQLARCRDEEARRDDRAEPPQQHEDDREPEDVPEGDQEFLHAGTSSRTEWCQDRRRRSSSRAAKLMRTPSRPVARMSAYIVEYWPAFCA